MADPRPSGNRGKRSKAQADADAPTRGRQQAAAVGGPITPRGARLETPSGSRASGAPAARRPNNGAGSRWPHHATPGASPSGGDRWPHRGVRPWHREQATSGYPEASVRSCSLQHRYGGQDAAGVLGGHSLPTTAPGRRGRRTLGPATGGVPCLAGRDRTRIPSSLKSIGSALPSGRAAEEYGAKVAAKLLTRARADRERTRRVGTKDPARAHPGGPWSSGSPRPSFRIRPPTFFDDRQRQEMQQRLCQISWRDGPYIVIAHSQGSVIAYDVLRELDDNGAPFEVPLFITIGSPLGIEEVQDHLPKPLQAPQIVKESWNFADPVDPVAFDKTLADESTPPIPLRISGS